MLDKNRQVLQEWFMSNMPDDNMLWKNAFKDQVLFVRDYLMPILGDDYSFDIPSTHRSKSINLPVYRFVTKNYTCIMRENFYGWMVSISSLKNINDKLLSPLCLPDLKISSCYCEGFSEEWVFDSFKNNKREFTTPIQNNHKLYTFLYILNVMSSKNFDLLEN